MRLLKLLINLIPIKKVRRRIREKYFPNIPFVLKIEKNDRCLMVCPHPDDEMLGAGGMMIKYAQNFDCICLASAGVKTPKIEAEARANLRIDEFNKVMDSIGIKQRWIFKTFGIPPMNDQIEKYYNNYCSILDTKQFDYIFIPHPRDNHPEHKYIVKNIFKRILQKKGYKKNAKVIFYEVWQPLQDVNWYENISDVADKKFSTLSMYESQNGWINYPDRVEGLNKYRGMLANNIPYAEAFQVVSIQSYLRGKYE